MDGGEVSFGDPVEVEQIWQEVPSDELDDDDLNEIERQLLADVLDMSENQKSYLSIISSMASGG